MGDSFADFGNDIQLFSGLNPDEINILASSASRGQFKAGDTIFKEGDPGGSLQVIISGKVKIVKKILAEVERTMLTLQRGGVFGELSVLSGESRTATAIAAADTELLCLERDVFIKVTESNPELGRKLNLNLLKVVGNRLQTTTEQYRQAVGWGLEISGAVKLNYHQLIADHISITIELLNGSKVSGQLLRAEINPPAAEMMVKTEDERIVIIPVPAIAQISFQSRPVAVKDN